MGHRGAGTDEAGSHLPRQSLHQTSCLDDA
jgi:hypothetical protein